MRREDVLGAVVSVAIAVGGIGAVLSLKSSDHSQSGRLDAIERLNIQQTDELARQRAEIVALTRLTEDQAAALRAQNSRLRRFERAIPIGVAQP